MVSPAKARGSHTSGGEGNPSFSFLRPKPIDIALLFKQFLNDLGSRFW